MIWKPKRNHDLFVSINFMPHHLTLCAIKKTALKTTSNRFQIKAFNSLPLSHNEYHEGKIYNLTVIGKHIGNFLSKYGTRKTPLAFTIGGEHIDQQFISGSQEQLKQATPNKLQEACALYSQNEDHSMFYRCSIERSIIMQYQLVAIAHKINLQALSTHAMAHINLYRFLHNDANSAYALIALLEKNNNDTAQIICPQQVAQIIDIPAHIETSVANFNEIQIALGAIIPFI